MSISLGASGLTRWTRRTSNGHRTIRYSSSCLRPSFLSPRLLLGNVPTINSCLQIRDITYLRTFKLTGAKSERADTLRTRRGDPKGVSGCTAGDAASLTSLSVMLRKRAYTPMCLRAGAISTMRNRPDSTIGNARFVDIVCVKELFE